MLVFRTLAPLAITLPEHPTLGENIVYQMSGFLVVMVALAFLSLAIKVAGALFSVRRDAPKDVLVPRVPGGQETAHLHAGVSPEIIAVMVAAVHSAMGPHGRILAIHEHPDHLQVDPQLLAWSMEGRRQLFSSHQPR